MASSGLRQRGSEWRTLAAALICCGVTHLLLPTPAGASEGPPEVVFVKGRIRDEFTRPPQPLARAEVCNTQGDCVVTNRRGRFKRLPLRVDPANYPGYYKLVARHDECYTHEFWVRVRKPGRQRRSTTLWTVSAVPMQCLNLQWRWLGWPEVPNGHGGSIRWMTEPENIIVANRLQCLATREETYSECVRFEVLDEPVVEGFHERVRTFIGGWPEYTRFLKGNRIRTIEYPPGEILELADLLSVPESITWMAVKGFRLNFAIRAWYPSGALFSVAVEIDSKYEDDDFYIHHEGWHALGAAHKGEGVQGRDTRELIEEACPDGSLIGWSLRVSDADIATARAVYSRPSGSKRPDRDPVPESSRQTLNLGESDLYLDSEACRPPGRQPLPGEV